MSRQEIPIINLTLARFGSASQQKQIAREVDRASRDIGFFIVAGSGVPESVIDAAYAAFSRFIARPIAEKNACRLPDGPTLQDDPYTPYGYSAMLEENAFAYMGEFGHPGDYVEKFSVGRLVLNQHAALPFPPNTDGDAMRVAFVNYFRETRALAALLARLFELALDRPAGFFTARISQSADSMRCHSYPAMSPEFANDQGMGEHQDGSLVTLLTHTAPGIEVKSRDGNWLRVPVTSLYDYTVNIGDLLSHWTEGVYVSTPHRVALTDHPRKSIAFFKLTDEDQLTAAGDRQMDALLGR